MEWYRLLDDSHLLDWEKIVPLFYAKFYPLHEIHQDRKFIYNLWPRKGESIAQAWERNFIYNFCMKVFMISPEVL